MKTRTLLIIATLALLLAACSPAAPPRCFRLNNGGIACYR